MAQFFKLQRRGIPALKNYIKANPIHCYDMHLALSDKSKVKTSATAYGYGTGDQLTGLAIFQSNGSLSCHFSDAGVFQKVDFLKALKEHKPTIVKADTAIIQRMVNMLARTMVWYEVEDCQLMQVKQTDPNQVKHVPGIILMDGNAIDSADVVPFMVEVEKAFGRAHLTVNQMKEKLDQTPAYLFAYDGDQVVGQAVIEHQTDQAAQLGGVYVKKAYRGKGIGTALSASLAADQLQHVGEVNLLVVRDNVAAITSYEKIGFQPVGEISRLHLQLR